MSKKNFIIHFLPLEGYPPILNLLDFFSDKEDTIKIICCSTKGEFKSTYSNKKTKINRFGKSSDKKIFLWLSYLFFNLFTILLLLVKRPKNVMYYETISSLPAYIYKKYINKNANLFIHYHEYVTLEEYSSGSRLNQFFHQLEQKIYGDAKWISHTNEVRLHKFLSDNSLQYNNETHKTTPNYPSKKWGVKNTKWINDTPLKLIFVGYSVDPNGCFILELIEWLSTQKQQTILDIYCIKKESLPSHLTSNLENITVNIMESVAYKELPQILKEYHIGLILYRGLAPNYIYNAPNKLFEYLACGLDVWFPKEMNGCYPYISTKSHPKVLKFDFSALDQLNLKDKIDADRLKVNETQFYYEKIYDSIYYELE